MPNVVLLGDSIFDNGAYVRDGEPDVVAQLRRLLPAVVCTVYEGSFPDRTMQRLASAALTVFNDVIVREAAAARIPLIDLRAVCREPADYANPIEPSAIGGERIAGAIGRVVLTHDFTAPATVVYAG